jgi:hypothetical protein
MSLYIPVSAYTAFGVSLLIAIVLVLTKNMHGRSPEIYFGIA